MGKTEAANIPRGSSSDRRRVSAPWPAGLKPNLAGRCNLQNPLCCPKILDGVSGRAGRLSGPTDSCPPHTPRLCLQWSVVEEAVERTGKRKVEARLLVPRIRISGYKGSTTCRAVCLPSTSCPSLLTSTLRPTHIPYISPSHNLHQISFFIPPRLRSQLFPYLYSAQLSLSFSYVCGPRQVPVSERPA